MVGLSPWSGVAAVWNTVLARLIPDQRPSRHRHAAPWLALAAILAASLPGVGLANATEAPAVTRLAGEDRIATAVAVSQAAFQHAHTALIARADAFADALVGAPLAVDRAAPVLLTEGRNLPEAVGEELARLGVSEVVLLGGESAVGPEVEAELRARYAVQRVAGPDRYGTAAEVARLLPPGDRVYVATGTDFPDAVTIAPVAGHLGAPVLLVEERVPAPTQAVLDERNPAEVVIVGGQAAVSDEVFDELARGWPVRRVAGRTRYETAALVHDAGLEAGLDPGRVWFATGADFPDALTAGAATAQLGTSLLLVDGFDLGHAPEPVARLQAHADRHTELTLVGGRGVISGAAPRQLDAVRAGRLLPRGGTRLFPGFRVVAHFGGPQDPRLGILGHGTPDEAAARLVEHTRPYAIPQPRLLPAFELIATIATRDPGPEGHYSRPLPPDQVQAYLDAVRRVDGLLVLDIQPGRSDFLTELRRHERFLLEPDVGVALDPEWRMQAHERPGERVGHVEASEINAVSAYLAGLVTEHGLPDKVLVLHQFQHQMIRDRPAIQVRDQLAITIHMDGFGSRQQKLETYRQVRAEPPLWNGFKVFLEQDTDPFQPHEVMALDPPPSFVSYQ